MVHEIRERKGKTAPNTTHRNSGRFPDGKTSKRFLWKSSEGFRRSVERWKSAERLLAKQKKEKVENGGQAGGRVAVSEG